MNVGDCHTLEQYKLSSFLVGEFGGDPLTIRRDGAVVYLEWSLPNLSYIFGHGPQEHSRLLTVKLEGSYAVVRCLA